MGLVGKGELWFGWLCVLELSESFQDIPGRGEMNFAMCIVPVETDADVTVASPIGAERIIGF